MQQVTKQSETVEEPMSLAEKIWQRKLSRHILVDFNRPRGKHQANRVYKDGKLIGYKGITEGLPKPDPIVKNGVMQLHLREIIPRSLQKSLQRSMAHVNEA